MTRSCALVLVNYNGGRSILDCLQSIDDELSEVVVVDNASTDGSDALIERERGDVRLIRNEGNVGFAAAANQAIRATSADVVVLLNPDVIVRPGALGSLVEAVRAHPKAGVVAPLILNPDGSVQPTKRAFPSIWQAALHGLVGLVWPGNPGTRAYTLADASFAGARTVDWAAGTAMAIKREAFEAVGGFDERFFFFVEDVDLCKRMWDASFEVWFEPEAVIVHEWGGSWTQRPLKFLWMHQLNLFRYVLKHRRGAWVAAYPFIALGLLARFGLLALRWVITRRSVPKHRRLEGSAS
ncbi:MAG: glycosyltransferase family 2 protein [Actinomycetota bacterium]